MTRSHASVLALLAASLPVPVFAQDAIDLGTLVLSGGLTPIATEALGRSASVLTGAEIEARGITNVQEALRAIPGVAVTGSGSNSTQVRIRGGEGNHTLVLIDGIEAAAGDSEYFLSGLETANIERIEVLRGPQSAFYGSDASSGVINIITRNGAIGQQARLTFEGGGGFATTTFLSTRSERGGLSLSFSDTNDDGWDFSGSGGEKDFTDRTTLILKGDIRVTPDLTLGVVLRDSSETYASDGTNGGATRAEDYVVDSPFFLTDREEFTGSVYADLSSLGGQLTHRLSFDRTENTQTFLGTSTTEVLKYRLSYGLDGQPVTEASQVLNVLLESQEDTNSRSPQSRRESDSIAVEYRAALDTGLDLQVGIRRDFNDPFADATTWNVAASYLLANDIRLHASAGTGNVNPTYFEISDNFFPAFGSGSNTQYDGNTNLTPERNRSFDIGVEVPILQGRGVIDVTYFNETLVDEITTRFLGFDAGTNTSTFTFVNQQGESTREGVELSGSVAATDTLDLRFAYTYLDARNPDGSVEVRRPKHEVTFGATLRAFDDRATFTADIRHVAGNFDTQFFGSFNTVELPSFTTADIAARYALSETVDLTARVENVFDDDAVEVVGYIGRPRTVYVGLDARW